MLSTDARVRPARETSSPSSGSPSPPPSPPLPTPCPVKPSSTPAKVCSDIVPRPFCNPETALLSPPCGGGRPHDDDTPGPTPPLTLAACAEPIPSSVRSRLSVLRSSEEPAWLCCGGTGSCRGWKVGSSSPPFFVATRRKARRKLSEPRRLGQSRS